MLAWAIVLLALSLRAQSQDFAEKSHRAKDLMAAQRFAEAVPIYRELVQALPGNPGLLMNLGLALDYSGHKREALSEFEKVLRLDPGQIQELMQRDLSAQITHNVSAGLLTRVDETHVRYTWHGMFYLWFRFLWDVVRL